jgi:hypothetical protein
MKRIGTDIFINIPKLIIATMPWKEPPSPGDKREKQGLPASEVVKLYRTYSPLIQ